MITKISSLEELKSIFVEILLNKTDKVTKVSNDSVLNGVAYGCAKVGQKALKDIALVESHLFPDSAFGFHLDQVASDNGISPRFSASESSTYLRVVADPGTTYTQGVHVFSGNNGIDFQLEANYIVGVHGFIYAKVKSLTTGSKTNVEPLTVTKVNPVPAGHKYVINEAYAIGGRDIEQDDVFRRRIKTGANLAARDTLAHLTEVFRKVNPNVLRIYNQGFNGVGKIILGVVAQNGINFTLGEFDNILAEVSQYLNLTDLQPYGGNVIGVVLQNIVFQPIDISFRVDLLAGFNPDAVRKEIQLSITKYLDFRFWTSHQRFEWDNVLELIKQTKGVKYVPDTSFTPNNDIIIDQYKLPRLRGCLMLDLNGNIISNVAGTLNPIFYPSDPSFSFSSTILASL